MGRRLDFGDIDPTTERYVPAELQKPLAEAIRAEAARIVELGALRAEGKKRTPEDAAAEIGVDLSRECPVCRSLDPCACSEPDRAFYRRTRFVPGLVGIPRCPRCRGPMSTFYVPRIGTSRDLLAELKQHDGLTACVACDGGAIGMTLTAIALVYPREDSP